MVLTWFGIRYRFLFHSRNGEFRAEFGIHRFSSLINPIDEVLIVNVECIGMICRTDEYSNLKYCEMLPLPIISVDPGHDGHGRGRRWPNATKMTLTKDPKANCCKYMCRVIRIVINHRIHIIVTFWKTNFRIRIFLWCLPCGLCLQ